MSTKNYNLPEGFVYLDQVDPTIIQEIRYTSHDNFTGRPIAGYMAPRCILTFQAAHALAHVQEELKKAGLGVKVFDGYRPQLAVDDFIVWSKNPTDQIMKALYYPNVNKADFFTLGYVAEKSSHTRGSTIDLTIINAKTLQELPMGTNFDFMDVLSHPSNKDISKEAYANRMLLQNTMQKYGFDPIETEWWHFTLKDEPYKDEYFNFPVK